MESSADCKSDTFSLNLSEVSNINLMKRNEFEIS